jgi:hypothetical protein
MLNEEILKQFDQEIYSETIGDWRPIDAFRLRLPDLVRPKNLNKYSDEKIHPIGVLITVYKTIRYLKPELVVETGVQNGATTELILGAMVLNKKGKLYSIDCGSIVSESSDKTWDGNPGQYVRTELRDRWDLRLGLSKDVLPVLVEELKASGKTIDVFHHDSDHSTENIEFEMRTVLPVMSDNSIICMHDRQNRCFESLPKHETIRIDGITDLNFDYWVIKKSETV